MSLTLASGVTDALAQARQRTLELISGLDADVLEAVHSPLLSPLVWDLGHIAAFEDLWISRTLGHPMLEPELIAVYDADETPRAERGDLPFLRTAAALDFLARRRAATLRQLADAPDDPVVPLRVELIVRHELQHHETMLQTCQIAALDAGLEQAAAGPEPGPDDGLEPVGVTGGHHLIGAPSELGFAYDNERPRHPRELADFAIGRSCVSNRAWQAFIDAGGYERRELWSARGWEWRTDGDVHTPLYWTGDGSARRFGTVRELDPDAPVCHVSFFEAEAFAMSHGARLPQEFEWEAAHAAGVLGQPTAVWQWCANRFEAYPGFRADPYPEYSEQFFGGDFRVLRGGAWLSSPRVATPHFRNWDHLERRQIFSGVRLAWDV